MDFAGLQNYYEHLVFEYVRQLTLDYPHMDEEFFLDVACYALTRLPPRYIRHHIDMLFHLTPAEQEEMEKLAIQVVDTAAKFISARMEDSSR